MKQRELGTNAGWEAHHKERSSDSKKRDEKKVVMAKKCGLSPKPLVINRYKN